MCTLFFKIICDKNIKPIALSIECVQAVFIFTECRLYTIQHVGYLLCIQYVQCIGTVPVELVGSSVWLSVYYVSQCRSTVFVVYCTEYVQCIGTVPVELVGSSRCGEQTRPCRRPHCNCSWGSDTCTPPYCPTDLHKSNPIHTMAMKIQHIFCWYEPSTNN